MSCFHISRPRKLVFYHKCQLSPVILQHSPIEIYRVTFLPFASKRQLDYLNLINENEPLQSVIKFSLQKNNIISKITSSRLLCIRYLIYRVMCLRAKRFREKYHVPMIYQTLEIMEINLIIECLRFFQMPRTGFFHNQFLGIQVVALLLTFTANKKQVKVERLFQSHINKNKFRVEF